MRMQQSVYLFIERFYVDVNNTNVLRSSCKVTDCFFPILTKFGFSKQILVKVFDINIRKIRPVLIELICAEGQADMMKLNGLIRKRLKSL